jgi:YihY family inner membrane protein
MRAFLQPWAEAFRKHRLLTYAWAIAMRAFIGLAGLTFLTLALLGATGHREVWQRHVAPTIEPKLTHPTYVAINAAVEKIFASHSAGLIAFASVYAVWQVSGAVRAVMDALNAMIGRDERRSVLYRIGLSVALAVVVIALIACAVFVVAVSSKLLGSSGGVWHWLVAVLRWPAGAVFLGVAVGIVARFAPVEHRGGRWASIGATVIVAAWLVESALYAWYLKDFADYKTASGNLLLLLVVTTYLYISSIVFLVGAQLDEFLRQDAKGNTKVGVHHLAKRLF